MRPVCGPANLPPRIMEIDVVLAPAEIARLPERDLRATTCVVFDVLRATSTMLAALTAGAAGILPVSEIPEALAARERHPGALLAGERDGKRITAEISGGVEFDLGNSPREMTPERVGGRLLVTTTTNGTRAIRAVAGARQVLISSFTNLDATADRLKRTAVDRLLLVCSGTGDIACLEDTLAAGTLMDRLRVLGVSWTPTDAACLVEMAFQHARRDLGGACRQAKNARRLLEIPELADDVNWCLALDRHSLVGALEVDGIIRTQR